jgi:ribose 5-phosphate isomerase B
MKVSIGCDHAGYEVKEQIKGIMSELGIEIVDYGTNSTASVDYPEFGAKVGKSVASGETEQGIVICGSGTGIAIAANKIKGVRAVQAWSEEVARLAREHNDANVIAIGARVLSTEQIDGIIRAWFAASYEGERHQPRVDKLSDLEG